MGGLRRILLVGGDLKVRDRVQRAAERAGLAVETIPVGAVIPGTDFELAVVDLDSVKTDAIEGIALQMRGAAPRVVGFFSHVDPARGDRATGAGIESYARGRFWRTLDEIIGGPGT